MDWKAPPADPSKLWINKSMEMQILLACNWSCQACDQHSNFHGISFVKKATMTSTQIASFLKEMRDKNAYLGRIRLVGGEPTLHPHFADIVALLNTLVTDGYVGRLEVVTNGSHPEKIKAVRGLVKVRISGEEAKEKVHVANLVTTPAELGYEGKMCNAPWHCGFSLNYYGYFPCSSGAGIARMRDWMQHQRLTLPTPSVREAWPDLQQLCNFCYHGLKAEDKVKCGTKTYELNVPSPDAWKQLSPWLNGKQPDWPIYASGTT